MKHQLSNEAIEAIADRFRLLSEPLRLRILHLLREGEMTVGELTNRLAITQPNASKHLRILQEAGILRREQRGNLVYYSIRDESIFQLCEVVCDSLGERFRQQAEIFSIN
ncbi:MAG: transcriptional regulator [Blastocatellia bacterium]